MKAPENYSELLKKLTEKNPLPQSHSGFEEIWNSANNFEYPKVDSDKSWLRLESNLDITPERKTPTFFIFNTKWAVAAAITLILGLGVIFYQNFDKESLIETREWVNNSSQNQVIILPDGSTATLNAFSSLKTSPKFNKSNRSVTLTGEAFFEVEPNKDIPFLVQTGNIKTIVTGTKFNVDFYDQNKTLISLTEGAVNLEWNGDRVAKLNAGEQAKVSQNEGLTKITEFAPQQTIAWLDNVLVFENQNVTEVVKRLESVYNVKLNYPASLANTNVTTVVPKGDLETVLKVLSETLEEPVTVVK